MTVTDAPAGSPAFPVHWDDPADANFTYTTDMMHNPDPMSPLQQSLQPSTFYGWQKAMREFGMPFKAMHVRFQNFYQYDRVEMIEPASPEEARAGGEALEATMKVEVARLGDRWENEHLPRTRQIIDRFIAMEHDSATASLVDIAAMLDEFENLRAELWTIHFRTVLPMMLAMQTYDELYADLFGGTEADAHILLGGRLTRSVAAGIGLSDLAATARAAGLDRLIIETPLESLIQELRMSEDGRAVLDELGRYLDEFGYRSDLFDIMTPTWRENLLIPLAAVRAYLMNGFNTSADHDAKARAADEALNAARGRLASYPEPVRQQFEAMVRAGRVAASLQEDHNFYIDQHSVAWTRLLFLQIGGRLAAAGVLDSRDDIFMIRLDEIRDLLSNPIDDSIRGQTRKTVAERGAGIEHAMTLTPPPFLGPPPEAPTEDNVIVRGMDRFWGAPPRPAEGPGQLMGNAGSRGVATGEAFVAHNLSDATNLQPGQILIAMTTMPAWTPFFGVAAAVVTETGGPLSHCAVVAREYGIPAVVGAAGAMSAIQPGQRITVDGGRGIVLLNPDE
ncbi:MAG TPA: PEP-utilizing enzyme [Thermomicrobiales bacterium]|nr:PEP-utilizing enzyme [Thermomicrobiales bacterium]